MMKCIPSLMESLQLGLVHSRQEPRLHPSHLNQPPARSLQLNGLRIANQPSVQLPLIPLGAKGNLPSGYIVSFETIRPAHTQQVSSECF